VVHDHVRCKSAIETRAGLLCQLVVVRHLLCIGPVRRRYIDRFRRIDRLLVRRRVVVGQHLPELLDVVILPLLLRQFSHLDFGKIAFDGLFDEGRTVLLRSVGGRGKEDSEDGER
jgi:hypothetical protein